MIWDILTSIGTLGAVAVALVFGVIPLWRDRKERRQRAKVVGTQAYSLMVAIHARCCRPFVANVENSLMTFENKDYELMEAFNAIFPQLVVLTAKELKTISQLFFFMKSAFAFDRISEDDYMKMGRLVREHIIGTFEIEKGAVKPPR